LLTNRFDLRADEIAEIHNSRWAIKLFLSGEATLEYQEILWT